MSEERYFPNPYSDYDERVHGNSDEFVPTATIHKLIRHFVELILNNPDKNQREDLYVGAAGTAFMFWKLAKSAETAHLYPCLDHAAKYILQAKTLAGKKGNSPKNSIAFLCGNAGIAAVSAAISHAQGNHQDARASVGEFLKGYPACGQAEGYDADEVLVGRAGYLHGAYWLNQVIDPKPIENTVINDLCNVIVKRGRLYASNQRARSPLMYAYHGKEYLGAAHGVSAILHALLESHWFIAATEGGKFENCPPSMLADIRNSIDFVLSLQTSDGNFPTRRDSDRCLVHWCHGCAGIIYLLAKAYLIFKDERYLEGCRSCANSIWQRGLLRKGPGICHGVAGNGYAFLLMYRLTGEKQYLYRAAKFAEFLASNTCSAQLFAPDRPYSLYEGLAGAVCFLVDVLEPSAAAFPFMDVFERKVNLNIVS
ncbi:lanC-like protein 3 homolog [Anopheles aquasalis]|uniref:lanC-like protein 3 homolog n=1 Tax=Anopheles aquasalis TaxID=42839 RepID=UPI00215B39F8|nr:lanC-like protein 3 homolog [Anopheles aquasalis]